MTVLKAGVVAVLVLGAVGAQAANLVANGSFEADSQRPNTWSIYSNLTGWTGGRGGVELRNHVAGVAQNGVNFVELDTTKNSKISQKIGITHAGSYALSFWYQARPDNGNRNSNTDALGWSFGGYNGTVLNNWKAIGATDWQQFKQTFTITDVGQKTLAFSALGKSDSYGGSIDNVSVSLIPEPKIYALFLVGLGLMGTIVRRRSRSGTA